MPGIFLDTGVKICTTDKAPFLKHKGIRSDSDKYYYKIKQSLWTWNIRGASRGCSSEYHAGKPA